MKKIVTIAGVLIGSLIVGQGVAQPSQSQSKEKIKALEFMVGEWSGSGWMMTPDMGRVEFTQKEVIAFGLNGAILHIEGQGWNPEGKLVHNALAVLSYDGREGKYFMNSFLEDGKQGKAELELQEDGKVKWWFSPQPGQPAVIEYLITIADDTWTEKGRYSPDGQQWFPFIEFTLKRKS